VLLLRVKWLLSKFHDSQHQAESDAHTKSSLELMKDAQELQQRNLLAAQMKTAEALAKDGVAGRWDFPCVVCVHDVPIVQEGLQNRCPVTLTLKNTSLPLTCILYRHLSHFPCPFSSTRGFPPSPDHRGGFAVSRVGAPLAVPFHGAERYARDHAEGDEGSEFGDSGRRRAADFLRGGRNGGCSCGGSGGGGR
jgi:hypothetical protein